MLAVENGDGVAPVHLRGLPRHVPSRPGRPPVLARVELVAAGPVVVRTRHHVVGVDGIDLDVGLIVRERFVAVEVRVLAAALGYAFKLRVGPVLLVVPGDVHGHRALAGHPCLREGRSSTDAGGERDQECHRRAEHQYGSKCLHASPPPVGVRITVKRIGFQKSKRPCASRAARDARLAVAGGSVKTQPTGLADVAGCCRGGLWNEIWRPTGQARDREQQRRLSRRTAVTTKRGWLQSLFSILPLGGARPQGRGVRTPW